LKFVKVKKNGLEIWKGNECYFVDRSRATKI
jgi:hypothetical protein